jgi:hypothetical protein
MPGIVKRYVRPSWREAIVAVILGAWLTVGLVWGSNAALIFAFPLFVGCALTAWGRLTGRLVRDAGAGYYRRQLDPHRTGHWRGR